MFRMGSYGDTLKLSGSNDYLLLPGSFTLPPLAKASAVLMLQSGDFPAAAGLVYRLEGPSRFMPALQAATLHTVGVDHCPLRSVAPGEARTGT